MAYVTSGDASIYYEVHGDGPCVVFAHGRGGNAASWWQQVPRFAETYKVIVFDHRCFGRSRCPSAAFDREQFDTDLVAILDAEGIGAAAVVCQSMGGWTGLRTALRHPDRVRCLVLSNTPGGVDTAAVRGALRAAREMFASEGVGGAAVADGFADRAPEAAYLYRHINSLNLQIPDALSHGGAGWVPPEALRDLRLPVLVISSAFDQIFPPAVIAEVAGLIPGAQFTELPGAGHSPYYETPAAFNRTVKAFLDRHCRET